MSPRLPFQRHVHRCIGPVLKPDQTGKEHRQLNRLLQWFVVVGAVDARTAAVRRVVVGGAGNLAGEFLECLALGLGNEQGSETTAQHEESIDLHDVVEPGRGIGLGSATRAKLADGDLGDDGADLARGGGDAVGGRAIPGGEALAGNDEGGCVRTAVDG